jgi:hypothetical protein
MKSIINFFLKVFNTPYNICSILLFIYSGLFDNYFSEKIRNTPPNNWKEIDRDDIIDYLHKKYPLFFNSRSHINCLFWLFILIIFTL